jgi:hypothetical protein
MTAINVPVPPDYQRGIDAKSQALLQQLVNATPTQITAYLTANSTNIAQVNVILQALAVGLRYLYLKQSGN